MSQPLPDLHIIHATRRGDERGFFEEVFRHSDFEQLGLPSTFVQVNHSRSLGQVRRGLHFQWKPAMGKTMRVIRGEAFLVAVDIRPNSPTLGQWYGNIYSEDDSILICAPAGFARGFQSLSDVTEVEYFTTSEYDGRHEGAINALDAALGIAWPSGEPVISEKDQVAGTLADWLLTPESNEFHK